MLAMEAPRVQEEIVMAFVPHFTSESEKEEYKKNLRQRIERSRSAMRVVQSAVLDYGEEAAEVSYINIEEDWFSPENITSSVESQEVVVRTYAKPPKSPIS
jgi:hypothetical protein